MKNNLCNINQQTKTTLTHIPEVQTLGRIMILADDNIYPIDSVEL